MFADMGTDALRKTERLKWEVPTNLDILSKTIDVPASPDPVLQLACFVKPPRICFDNVKIGATKVKVLKIFNPGEEIESIILEKFPDPELGFAIEGLHPDEQLYLQPGEEVEVKILWQPVRPGNTRHLVTFRWIGGQKLQLVLLSSAYDPNAGKKKRARQIPSKRVLHSSHRMNIQQGKVQTKAKGELLIQGQRKRGYESPNVKHLVEIAPDTPSRRSTFTVAQPGLEKKDGCRVCNDEKENISITAENHVNRATFSVEKATSHEVIADEVVQTVKTATNNDDKKLRLGMTSFEGKISDGNGDDDQSVAGSTFHESEIRLSSSPIKWRLGYERITSSTYKRELHPGQVVLNGKVKHEFIPYPSFDNTDTFLNMEMSTTGKHRAGHEDESLSFDSAASSLFTITREEKFYPHLEPVKESYDVPATPKSCISESKTLTNETDTGTPMPNENGAWMNEVRESKDFSFAVAREEKFCPKLEPLKEASYVAETPKALQSRTLTNETYTATPLPPDKCTEDGETVCDDMIPLRFPGNTDEIVNSKEVNDPIDNDSLQDVALESSHVDNIENRDDTPSQVELWTYKDEANAEHRKCSSGQATSAVNEIVVGNPNIELASKQVVITDQAQGDEEIWRGKDRGRVFSNASVLERSAQKSSFASRNTSKKAISTQKPSGIKYPHNAKKTEKSRIVQPKYMNSNSKGEIPGLKKNKISMKTKPRKENNVIDAKFKGINLPQKRRNDTATSTGKPGAPAVAIKKLKLIKPQEKIARHPMPFAAKNMFYDERWIEKQERGFKNWLNFVLTPPDDNVETRNDFIRGTVCLESDSNQPVAPTKEMLSFRMYAAKRRMAKLRRDACMLYQTDQFASVIQKIEREIEHGRLAIRVDRHVDADLGVRKHIADMLLSFNPLWLRIGLEVIYGEIIPVSSNDDASGISRFIHRRLLGNPDIAAEYSHPSVPGLFKPGYVEALGKFTLKKLLLVIIYLDNAKHSRLISHDPCLFNKDSKFKSTREMLLMFSRDYLHREGDIVKHLTYLGYTVSHVQTALHEYDFGVSSLAVDLRDGLRLVRVVELLTHNWSLSSKLRVPAVSRLQKIHNVELAFQGLKERNLDVKKDSNLDARLIVDGHREKTLSLLWKIIFHFQVDLLLDEEKLKDEIKYLERKNQLLKDYNEFRQNVPLKIAEDDLFENCSYSRSEKLGLLLHWCHLVGKLHGVQIENFTVSFSDGRALCYLLNHYHPSLLAKEEIRDETTSTCCTSQEESGDEMDSFLMYQHSKSKFYSSRAGENIMLETLLGNEKHNLNIFCEKVKEIGASPAMVLASDMSNTIPDEKVIITYLSFLCSRLLDLREEIRAARCIQLVWRQHRLHGKQKEHQNLVTAATKIQAMARGFLIRRRIQKKIDAVKVLQRNVRVFLSKKRQALQDYSATVIQQYFRSLKMTRIARQSFIRKRAAAVKIQRAYRSFCQVRNAYRQMAASCIQAAWKRYQVSKIRRKGNEAALILQKNWKRYVCRKRFLVARNAAMLLQSNIRAYLMKLTARAAFLRVRRAALTIQKCWRKFIIRRETAKLEACIVIQAYVRRYQCRVSYLEMKRAAVVIQSYVRKHRCQSQYSKLKRAAVYLQSTRRSLVATRNARNKLLRSKHACLTIQRMYRARIARRDFMQMRTSAVKVQTAWRGMVCRQKYVAMRLAAPKIQCAFRSWKMMCVERKSFIEVRAKIIKIQAAFRGHRQRNRFVTVRNATIKLQALLRGKASRERFLSLQCASATIQRHYRAVVLRRIAQVDYQQKREGIIKIQAWYRGKKARNLYINKKKAAICLQSSYRRLVAKRRFEQLKFAAKVIQQRFRAVKLCQATQVHYLITKAAAIKIQSVCKGYLVRKDFSKQRNAAILIQATFRGYMVRMSNRKKTVAASKIQSLYRGYLAMKEYRTIRCGVITIQRFYRRYLLMKAAANRFQQERAAVIKIQAVSRGFLSRKLLQRHKAARKLQAITRGYLQRKRYLKLLAIVSKVQARVRHNIECRRRDSAASCIQRRWTAFKHGRVLRAKYVNDKQACIKIQAIVRGWIRMRCYARFRSATLVIQRRFKAQSLMKEKKRDYQLMKRSAVVIQSACRMFLARKQFRVKKKASIVLQRQTRVLLARTRSRRETQAATAIQIWYKACREMKVRRIMFSKQKKAAVLLQAQQRGLVLRRKFALKKSAAIKIQAWHKMLAAKKRYVEMRHAVLVIQRRYRAFSAARLQQLYFHLLRGAIITIQACVRGFLARGGFLRKRKAAVCLQASWRRHVCEKAYRSVRKSVVKMQRNIRANALARIDRRGFLQKRAAAVILQRKMREYLAVKKAVIMVQAQFRMLRDRRKFIIARDSCIKIQICFRGFVQRKLAATLLQSSWRMYAARKSYLCVIAACVRIQSCVRGFIVRRRYMLCLGAALTIQRRYRAFVEGASFRHRFLSIRSSCVLLQAYARRWLARKNFMNLRTNSIVIQRYFRAHVAMKKDRNQFIELKSATLKIQTAYRGYAARVLVKCMREQKRVEEALKLAREQQILLERQEAATMIQKHFRRLQVRNHYVAMRENAIKVQQWYRNHLLTLKMRNEFLVKRNSVLAIQRAYKMHVARRYLEVLKKRRERLNAAATCIQSMFRCFTERRMFLRKKSAAKAIQVCFKNHLLAKAVRNQYLLKRSSAITIQMTYRSYVARCLALSLQKRRKEELNAIILIQKQIRGFICRRDYQRLQNAVVLIQCTYRRTRQMIDARDGYIELRNATLRIQHSYRAYLMRKAINKRITDKKHRIQSALIIQASFRRYKLISSLRTAIYARRAAAAKIQRCFREYLARKQLSKFRAALIIQRAYRQYKTEQNAIKESAATKIQAAFKGFIQRRQYQKLRAFTVALQRRVRQSLQRRQRARRNAAAIFIQSWYRSIRLLKRDMASYKKKKEATLCIQSVWRGYLVRRSIIDRKTIRARERIKSANMEATEPKKLCNRTKSALSYLLSCRYVSTIYDALKDLEVSTRLTKKCCERLVQDGGLPVIFQIIRNCNRSLPSIEQIHMALLVLTNVAKCETTYMAVIEEADSLQLLIELMANFRDKRKIFPNCCMLLSILCKDYNIVQMIQRSSILSKKLNALNSLICRKAEIELKRTNGKLNLRKDERKDLLPIIEQMSSITQLAAIMSPT